VPRPKSEFETLFGYEVYEPAELFDPDRMYTVAEVARLLQDLPPDADLDHATESRLVAWTIPWLFAHRDALCISDPVGDEPGYFGLRDGVGADGAEGRPASEAADEHRPVADVDVDADGEAGDERADGAEPG
jgi:hypothetical protein